MFAVPAPSDARRCLVRRSLVAASAVFVLAALALAPAPCAAQGRAPGKRVAAPEFAGVGWLGNPKAVAVPDETLQFVNYVGPILGGSIGATFGFIFGGGWVAKTIADREDPRSDA